MATINTIFILAGLAKQGLSWRDKLLSFLVLGLNSLGLHRRKLRKVFLFLINWFADKEYVQINLLINRRKASLSMRKENEGDYLIAGELVGNFSGYGVPNFKPRYIIDAGAHIGAFTVFAKNYFPEAEVTCYEPDSANLKQLNFNLSLNKIKADVRLLALWSGKSLLYYHSSSSQLGIVNTDITDKPIQGILPEIGLDCWLKLDIEGSEYEVLPALFEKSMYPRWISMEVHYFNTRGKSCYLCYGSITMS